MLSAHLKVDLLIKNVAPTTVVFLRGEDTIHAEAIASTLAGSLANNRPANRGPSLCQCWGRWTQGAEPAVKVRSESESTEMREH